MTALSFRESKGDNVIKAIALVELNSIARGIGVADAMMKAANVNLILSNPVCPGKYLVLVSGDSSAVHSAMNAAQIMGGHYIVDDLIISNIEQEVIEAINRSTELGEVNSIGVMEFFSIATSIIAADAAVKAAPVKIIEIRTGFAIGGKSYVTLSGELSSVKEAIAAGVEVGKKSGMLVSQMIVASPSKELFHKLL